MTPRLNDGVIPNACPTTHHRRAAVQDEPRAEIDDHELRTDAEEQLVV
jgi:hypothetical protein